MSTQHLVDEQFNRAVEIVQSLPKTGPIQTGYEEKLAMYSLYKQGMLPILENEFLPYHWYEATVGNVKTPRPGIWDMLGRAKWDAWANQKDLDPQQAKLLYVETLQKVLRKYSDKTVARDLVRELDSYAGDSPNMLMSGSFVRLADQSSSGSSGSASPHPQSPTLISPQHYSHVSHDGNVEQSTDDDGDTDEDRDPVAPLAASMPRPHSSLSSQLRYRTPIANSTGLPTALSPKGTPSNANIPLTQPLPRYTTPSAFASSTSPLPSTPYGPNPSHTSRMTSPPQTSSGQPYYRGSSSQRNFAPAYGPIPGMSSSVPVRPPLERAVESVQASLAALHERLETLESLSGYPHRSVASGGSDPSRRWSALGNSGPRGLSPRAGPLPWDWDPSNMGLWSLILQPLSRVIQNMQDLLHFLANSPEHSPVLVIVRRLFLDISFVLFVLAVLRALWRKSGIRRREVTMALVGLWRALIGAKQPRVMVDRGI